ERIIALDAFQQSGKAPLLVAVHEHFGVAVIRAESMTARHELGPQPAMVVDFAVEGDDDGAILVLHGLRGCCSQIDNREPAMTEGDLAVAGEPAVAAIRSAMSHYGGHAFDQGTIDHAATVRQQTRYSAHSESVSSFTGRFMHPDAATAGHCAPW